MTTLEDFAGLAAQESGLVIISTLRADSSIQTSLVNAGVLPHPITGTPVLGFVTYGPVKLGNLRVRPQVTVTIRSGWRWGRRRGPGSIDRPGRPPRADRR